MTSWRGWAEAAQRLLSRKGAVLEEIVPGLVEAVRLRPEVVAAVTVTKYWLEVRRRASGHRRCFDVPPFEPIALCGTSLQRVSGLRLGFIEPHLRRFGGIRRMLEFANRLVGPWPRGDVLPARRPDLNCTWMRCAGPHQADGAGVRRTSSTSSCSTTSRNGTCSTGSPTPDAGSSTPCTTRGLYGKDGSWESLRTPVDLQLANSNWTADQIFAEIGMPARPSQLGGANREMFQPYGGPKRYPILCSGGDERRPGRAPTPSTRPAGLLGVQVEEYAPQGPRPARPRPGVRRRRGLRRSAAGSRASASPGSRRWPAAPARHHRQRRLPRVRDRRRDRAGGAAARPGGDGRRHPPPARRRGRWPSSSWPTGSTLVERDFDWERRTDELAEVLDGVSAGTPQRAATAPSRPPPAARAVGRRARVGQPRVHAATSSSRSASTPTCPTS